MQVVQDRYAPGVQECFRRFDEDNSGSLGSSELRGALKSLGLAVTSTQAAAPAGPDEHEGARVNGRDRARNGDRDREKGTRRTTRNDGAAAARPAGRRSIDGDSSIHHAHDSQTPLRVRVYLLTYFFSSLTIDRQYWFFGLVPIGWIASSLCEWLGVPICHTNVQVQSVADPSEVAEFGMVSPL